MKKARFRVVYGFYRDRHYYMVEGLWGIWPFRAWRKLMIGIGGGKYATFFGTEPWTFASVEQAEKFIKELVLHREAARGQRIERNYRFKNGELFSDAP